MSCRQVAVDFEDVLLIGKGKGGSVTGDFGCVMPAHHTAAAAWERYGESQLHLGYGPLMAFRFQLHQ